MGFYTVYACRRARRVLAVEPNPVALAYLKANVALNGCRNTTIVPKAASDRRGVARLRIPRPGRRGLVPTTASIVWGFEEGALEVDVEADTLDSIVDEAGLDAVDFVKIDVEGAEGLVVRGAERTLRRAGAVLVEIWPENGWVAQRLRSLGYKPAAVVDRGIYRNYLFVKS
jgi:FkbM family methyltransferase